MSTNHQALTNNNAAHRAEKALERLAHLHPKLIDLGLDRTIDLLGQLGNPHHRLPPVIHVAGTNGKGSVVAFLRSLAEAAGLHVHAYTSPHLCRFNERIRLAGQLIDDAALADLMEEVETANGKRLVTFFEVTTAAAMLAFSRIPADLLLLETGLGGDLDSTNVLAQPAATIITPVARDHEHFLGTDLGEIAAQKAGIMRPDCPCFSAEQHPAALAALTVHAKKTGAPFSLAGRDFIIIDTDDGGFVLNQINQQFRLPAPSLLGKHQRQNAGLAAAAFRHVMTATGRTVSKSMLANGITNAVWPGRVQLLEHGILPARWPHRPVWLDGAHNAHGATALASTLASISDTKWNIICGALNTRDPADFLAPLVPLAGPVRCVAIPDQKASLRAEDLSRVATGLKLDARPASDLMEAFNHLDISLPVIICGSLYLAGYVLAHNGTPPE